MPDVIQQYTAGASTGSFRAVTPSDADDLAEGPPAGLYVTGAGDVAVQGRDGEDVTFEGVAAASFLPISPKKVLATGTTATGIIALY